jgi:hypothetical protein
MFRKHYPTTIKHFTKINKFRQSVKQPPGITNEALFELDDAVMNAAAAN